MLFMFNFEGSFHNDAFVYEFRDVASRDQRRRISGCTNFCANRRYFKIRSKSLLTSQLPQTECNLRVTRPPACTAPVASATGPATTSLIT